MGLSQILDVRFVEILSKVLISDAVIFSLIEIMIAFGLNVIIAIT